MNHYLIFALVAVAIQGLFALFEMACVSFNKIRLQYYVSLGTRRAIWINHLLNRPSRLFGTTLIGINTALIVGSECARRFYEANHLDPDWAPLSQVLIVVIFGELAPMFAARRHPEQVAMFFAPLMILISRILSPIIWAFDALSRLIHRAMGRPQKTSLFLSREEVKMAFEEREEKKDEFNVVAANIFQLKSLNA
ncbi:MAG TPA: CNNM domain-containing protein, partial [Chlamydiales bacterium]|nr:CNNM domain-containing protein [Chlamydiales bacterium]